MFMKKVFLATALLIGASSSVFVSCDSFSGPSKKELKATVDSLSTEISERDRALNESMEIFNKVSEGFRLINEAENRVNIQSGELENGKTDAKKQMVADIAFIQQKMSENRALIAELQDKLNKSNGTSAQLRKAVESLKAELEAKTAEITALREELNSKNIHIKELDDAVNNLTTIKNELTAKNTANEQSLAIQDKALNAAYYAIGSKKELKQNNILTNTGLFKRGDIMEDSNVNKDFFTQIDLRTTTSIPLGTKSAKILSTHPEGSYSLSEDESGMLTLNISDAQAFWSVTRYLVIRS